jgi:hypothetical protein
VFTLQGSIRADVNVDSLNCEGSYIGFHIQQGNVNINSSNVILCFRTLFLVDLEETPTEPINISTNALYRREAGSSISPVEGFLVCDSDSGSNDINTYFSSRLMKTFEIPSSASDIFAIYSKNTGLSLDIGDIDTRPIRGDVCKFINSRFRFTLQNKLVGDGNLVYVENDDNIAKSMLNFGEMELFSEQTSPEVACIRSKGGKLQVTGKRITVKSPSRAIWVSDGGSGQFFVDIVKASGRMNAFVQSINAKEFVFSCRITRVFEGAPQGGNAIRLVEGGSRPLIGGLIAVDTGACVATDTDFEILGGTSLFVGDPSGVNTGTAIAGPTTKTIKAYAHGTLAFNNSDTTFNATIMGGNVINEDFKPPPIAE